MTWEETIEYIRNKEEYKSLVKQAYFEKELPLNIERFKNDDEFIETLVKINKYAPNKTKILDIGCGNGISSISFALKGFEVTAVEPDPSDTIGAGAIRSLKEYYKLENIHIYESFAEDIKFKDNSFDIVYIRQAMHHANDLIKFIAECGRVLKKGGLLCTIRDHVVYNAVDKKWFLETHPLHKFYGGENAYTQEEYENAITLANLNIVEKLKHFDSVINYFPTSKREIEKRIEIGNVNLRNNLKKKIGFLSNIDLVYNMYKKRAKFPLNVIDETKIPGRMYTYFAIKK